jgi:hypothetical protein
VHPTHFSHSCVLTWGLRPSGMWSRVTGWLVPDVSKKHTSLFFKGIKSTDYYLGNRRFNHIIAQYPNKKTKTSTDHRGNQKSRIFPPSHILILFYLSSNLSPFVSSLTDSSLSFSFLFSIPVPDSYKPFFPIYPSLLSIQGFFLPATAYSLKQVYQDI